MGKKIYKFEVEVLDAGQRGAYSDSYYHYNVTSIKDEHIVKNFCMNVLKKSYERKDMPNPFAGLLIDFKKITNNNEGKSFLNKKEPETYSYKVKELYTG